MKIILTLILSVACIANATIKDKKLMLEKINELPPYMFHEESIESFQKTLKQGKFWVDQGEKGKFWVDQGEKPSYLYLFINGDGTFGERLFILDKKLNLYIFYLRHDEIEDDYYYDLYTYDPIKEIEVLIWTFKQSLFVN